MASEAVWKNYHRRQYSEIRPYEVGEDLKGITVPEGHTPAAGDMIVRNPRNRDDMWLIAKDYFEQEYESMESARGQSETREAATSYAAAADSPLMGNKRAEF